ncbi:MAG: iron-sulfur cluster assembly scaffold protein [Aquisalinus sp.]|nr:iron-sulfur cluster assembly scaffold protein [Aquisalinus sp.]
MLAKVYSNALLEAAGNIPEAGRLESPQATATKVSRVCGSEVTVDLNLSEGKITEFAVEAKACALGQAAASLVARHIIGATALELRALRDEMLSMLKEEGPPPTAARWAELEKLEPIRDYPARHASTMLVFEAVVACLDQLEEASV